MNKKNFRTPINLLLCTGFWFTALAQEKGEKEEEGLEQLIQEFPFSETVYLQEKNEIQQTLSGFHGENDETVSNSLGYEIEYGFSDWFQLSAGYSYEHTNTEGIPYNSGWLEAAAMIWIFNNQQNAGAVSLEAEFPVRKPDPEGIEAEDKPVYSPALIYATRLFPDTQLHLNVGAEIAEKEVNWFYNAAAVYGTGALHPLLELNVISEEEEVNWNLGTGLVINNENGWEVVSGYRHGINNKDWNATMSLIYEFKTASE